jgi:hypothetical protein
MIEQVTRATSVIVTALRQEDRSENVAFDAFSSATVPISSEGGPAMLLKIKNLSNHLCDFEPGGREFESLRARISIQQVSRDIIFLDELFNVCLCHSNDREC